jgi:hypothetical protein
MTISEADHILDIVSVALQDTSDLHHPISSLQGYDIFQICIALKLRIANEFLILADKDTFEEQFAEGLKLYGGIPWKIMMRLVPDKQANSISAKGVFNPIDPASMSFQDKQLASVETESSFGDYCRFVGAKDTDYWRKIYDRIGLEYTAISPRGNVPDK